MPIDESYNLYRCTICDTVERDKSAIEKHIVKSGQGRHNVDDMTEAELYYETRTPSAEVYRKTMNDIRQWRERVETSLQSMADPEKYPDDAAYTQVAERTNVPRSFVVFVMEDVGVTPTRTNGARLPESKRRTSWDSLTDRVQDTLLALAYFPEMTDQELAELPFSGAAGDPQVSRTRSRYLWILFHVGTDAPLSDWEPRHSEENDVETEGVEAALDGLDEAVEEEAEEMIEAMESSASEDSDREPQGERAEKADPLETARDAVGDLMDELTDEDEAEAEEASGDAVQEAIESLAERHDELTDDTEEYVETVEISQDLAFTLIRRIDDADMAWRLFEAATED